MNVARVKPTGRANARPMTGSAKPGIPSDGARIPDWAALHPGYEPANSPLPENYFRLKVIPN
jgi:hypothetical protein